MAAQGAAPYRSCSTIRRSEQTERWNCISALDRREGCGVQHLDRWCEVLKGRISSPLPGWFLRHFTRWNCGARCHHCARQWCPGGNACPTWIFSTVIWCAGL